jgi:putative Mn2+ efflux pump MntP
MLAVALSMDAFAVAVVSGISIRPLTRRHVVRMAAHFGFFQALMPIVGWGVGSAVHRYIAPVDHWVAFGLLAFVGGKMMIGALFGKEEENPSTDPTAGWGMLLLAIATSIDALAVGLSLAMIRSPIVVPALVIGLVAASITAAGMLLGKRIGALWGKRVEVLGGAVLLAIGIRIVAEHMLAR